MAGASRERLAEAGKLLAVAQEASGANNLVLVLSASEERARYWQAQLAPELAQQLGSQPAFLHVPTAASVDEFDLPNGQRLARDAAGNEKAVRGLAAQEVSALEAELEAIVGRLQSLQPWVDPAKAAEELAVLAKNKYAKVLQTQLLSPKA